MRYNQHLGRQAVVYQTSLLSVMFSQSALSIDTFLLILCHESALCIATAFLWQYFFLRSFREGRPCPKICCTHRKQATSKSSLWLEQYQCLTPWRCLLMCRVLESGLVMIRDGNRMFSFSVASFNSLCIWGRKCPLTNTSNFWEVGWIALLLILRSISATL